MNEKEPGLTFYIAFAVVFILLGLAMFGSCAHADSGGSDSSGGQCIGAQTFC